MKLTTSLCPFSRATSTKIKINNLEIHVSTWVGVLEQGSKTNRIRSGELVDKKQFPSCTILRERKKNSYSVSSAAVQVKKTLVRIQLFKVLHDPKILVHILKFIRKTQVNLSHFLKDMRLSFQMDWIPNVSK